MKYNFNLFFKNLYDSFIGTKNTHARLTRKRSGFLILFYIVWPIWGIIVWVSFFLDSIFFPSYKKQAVEKPLFILGNFRSGSTYLQRLIAKDHQQFASATTWDIFMSPSVSLTKAFSIILSIDRKLGSPIKNAFIKFDARTLGQVEIHKISFLEPEEDENFLLHIWSSFIGGILFPFIEDFIPYIYFDQKLAAHKRSSIMRFYYQIIQRFLFTKQGSPNFLSKNPSFSPKIGSIFKHFPNAKIVYLVRNPIEMLPSTISWLGYTWRVFSDPLVRYPFISEIIKFTKHWYDYPLSVLSKTDPANYLIIKYDDLVQNPEKTVFQIYDHFGYEMNATSHQTLKQAIAESKQFKSQHVYSFEKMGITHQEILSTYKNIFEQFEFDTNKQVNSSKDLKNETTLS
jgi:omega-hydroxy-beta-dihydromenaquinone-9 sulfotransferase